ncbi:MAG: TIGR04086 family membrane protein [Lachnospiraceae bacterium]|nr:TIGR04086 family membrane protein [Lachnospiraceae bacterium]
MEEMRTVTHKVMGVVKALICSGILTAAGLVILAFLLLKLELSDSAVAVGIVLIYFLSGFLGGFLLGKWNKKRKFLWGILLGSLYFSVLLLISVIIYQVPAAGDTHFTKVFFICMLGGMLGGILS